MNEREKYYKLLAVFLLMLIIMMLLLACEKAVMDDGRTIRFNNHTGCYIFIEIKESPTTITLYPDDTAEVFRRLDCRGNDLVGMWYWAWRADNTLIYGNEIKEVNDIINPINP